MGKKKKLNPGVRLMSVVKANAYGHGAVAIAQAVIKEGTSCLGVLNVTEALELREAGISAPIVLLSPPLPTEAAAVVRYRLEPTVDSHESAKALDRAAQKPVPIHVDVDSGLRRWGLPVSELPGFLRKLRHLKKLRLAGLSTHIDYVPGKNAVEAEMKLRRFQRLATWVRAERPGAACHAANSSILMDFPRWQMQMARIGNLLYGINPASIETRLKDPWRFLARIIAISHAGKGQAIGYAGEFIAPSRMTLATLPVGYADGLTMEPAERFIGLGRRFRYWGILREIEAPIVGRCAISHVLMDISRIPRARIGDVVCLPVRRTAASPRIPRLYTGNPG